MRLRALLLALVLLGGCQSPAPQPTPTPRGTASLEFQASQKPDYEPFREKLMSSKRMDDVVKLLNTELVLPQDLKITLVDSQGPHYDSRLRTIVIPYAFTRYVEGTLRVNGHPLKVSSMDGAVDATEFALLHETGHALINLLDLPIVGREEDAADDLATFLALEVLNRPEMAARTAVALDLMAPREIKESEFYDLHSLDEQRYFRILELLYGARPEEFEKRVRPLGTLPEGFWEKKGYAEREYNRISRSWRRLLQEHLQEPGKYAGEITN